MLPISQIIEDAVEQLQTVSDSARLDIELLLCSVIKKERSFFHAWPEHELEQHQLNSFLQLLELRLQGKPIAHILGERGFWSLNLKVTTDTLIPRPDTERLVELALELISKDTPQKNFRFRHWHRRHRFKFGKRKPRLFDYCNRSIYCCS